MDRIAIIIIISVMFILKLICGQKQDKVPNICEDNELFAIYNIGQQICVLRGEWFWQFNSFATIGYPKKQNAFSYIKTGFYINTIPECDNRSTSNMDCDHLRRAKFLKIVIQYNVNRRFDYYFPYRRIYNSNSSSFKDEPIVNDTELPWNLKHLGFPTSNIWPNRWLSNGFYGPVAYYSKYHQLVFIVNYNARNSQLIWYNIVSAQNTSEWRSKLIDDGYMYIGIIEFNSELYVFAVEVIGSHKLVVFHIESSDENRKYLIYKCDFQDLFGCNAETICPINMIIKEESATPINKISLKPVDIVIIVIAILVIIIALILTPLIIFIFYRHTTKSSKSRAKAVEPSQTNTVSTVNEDNSSIYTINSITGETVESETIRSD